MPVVDEDFAGKAGDFVDVVDIEPCRRVRAGDEMLQCLDFFMQFGDAAAASAPWVPLRQRRPDPGARIQHLLAFDVYHQADRRFAHSIHSFPNTGARSSRNRSSFAIVISRTGTVVLATTT